MRYCKSKPKEFLYFFLSDPKTQVAELSKAIGNNYDVALSKDEQSLLILCKQEGDIVTGLIKGNYIVIDEKYFGNVRSLTRKEFKEEFVHGGICA